MLHFTKVVKSLENGNFHNLNSFYRLKNRKNQTNEFLYWIWAYNKFEGKHKNLIAQCNDLNTSSRKKASMQSFHQDSGYFKVTGFCSIDRIYILVVFSQKLNNTFNILLSYWGGIICWETIYEYLILETGVQIAYLVRRTSEYNASLL